MAEMWKRTLSFLGLVEEYDDEYDDVIDDDLYYDDEPAGPPPPTGPPPREEPTNVRRIGPAAPSSSRSTGSHTRAHDRTMERGPERMERDSGSSRGAARQGRERSSTVHVTNPTTFNDVEEVGEQFRSGVPVIMNLAGASESVAKRLLDFASGLIFGLDGRIERVGDRVFLLTPVGTEVSTEERNRLSESGFFNQA